MTGMLTLLALLPGVEPAPAAWPSFRNGGAGVAAVQELPLTWSPTENVAWKADLPGFGQSSPVVWGDKVFVTAVDGKRREKGFLLAYDARTGKQLWAHEFEPTQKMAWSETISRAAPTPVVDADGVYAFFEGGNLLAREFGEFGNNHGLGGSPAQTGDTLFVLVDHSGPSYLLAVDKKTGKDGRTTVLKAGPAFERLATNALWDAEKAEPAGPMGFGGATLYGCAAVEGAIFARTGKALYRVGKP